MRWVPYAVSAAAVVATLAVAGAGTRPTTDWYAALTKPPWQPDPSLIGLAWAVIYPLIAIVGGFVWTRLEGRQQLTWALLLALNLVLNAAWSLVFFVAQEPWWAVAEITLLLVSTLALVVMAWSVSLGAGGALMLYAAWVAFAGWLTFTLARLNSGQG
ncbi:MAG: tryptophan-rich sensory protein [Actinomycetia bacterium]|nr:tryptophan-rich sensory protein [Actinomycetes bacterium]